MRKALFILLASLLPLGLGAQTPAQEDPDIQYASTLLAPGSKAPDFTLGTMDGRPFSLSSLAGRMVVLVFWASWCPDCRAEVPELKAMHDAAQKDKVAFVSVSFDRGLDALKAFAKDNALPGVQLFEPAGKKESAVGAAYGVKWIPSLYLLDEKGKVVLGTVVAAKIAKALGLDGRGTAPGELCTDESCALPSSR